MAGLKTHFIKLSACAMICSCWHTSLLAQQQSESPASSCLQNYFISPQVRSALTQYNAGSAPKAFAMSMRGAFAWSQNAIDTAQAQQHALEQCAQRDPVQCRIIAIDQQVICPSDAAKIMVQMGRLRESSSNQAWFDKVEKYWMPLVQASSLEFNSLLQREMGIVLAQDVRIYLASGHDDYERILLEEMKVSAQSAANHADVSGGLTNQKGQIAIVFLQDRSRNALVDRAIKTTLHELTHALENQLSHNYAGFRARKWIIEGSADLIAYTLAGNMGLEGETEMNLQAWKKRCRTWYRKNGDQLKPEDVFESNSKQWISMMKAKSGSYQMAGLMMIFLKEKLGEQFYPCWLGYFKQAAIKGESERAAFEKNFGLNSEAFLSEFKLWLNAQ